MRKVNKAIIVIVANIVVLIILLFSVDLFLGKRPRKTELAKVLSFEKRSIRLREFPPHIDKYFTPNNKYIGSTENLELKQYRIRTDNQGFIVGPDSFPQNNNSADFIFFGGSTTECMFVDEELRFPYLVGQLLVDKRTGMTLKSLNSGVSGNHSLHSLLNLLVKGINLQPKIVFFMHNINDLTTLFLTGSYWDVPDKRGLIQSQETKEKKRFRERKEHDNVLIFLIKRGIFRLYPNLSERIYSLMKPTIKETDVDEWKNYRHDKLNHNAVICNSLEESFEQSIRTFISVCRIYNIEVVLMTQFNRLNFDDIFIRNYYDTKTNNDFIAYVQCYDRFNSKIRNIAKQENLLIIDLADLVPSDKRFIYDPVHLNNNGSELVANIIVTELERFFPNYYRIN